MLSDAQAVAMIAVKDMAGAASFYENILGMARQSQEGDAAITYRCGQSSFTVYRSQFAGTGKATAMCWNVGKDIGAIAASLKAKGVQFQHYDMPDMALQGDVYSNDHMKVAWFTDPEGNILSLVGE